MYMSRRLVLQNSVAIENVLRNDLAFVLAQALDSAAIQGGGANEPEGIIEAISEHGTSESELSDIAADLIGALALKERNLDDMVAIIAEAAREASIAVTADVTARARKSPRR